DLDDDPVGDPRGVDPDVSMLVADHRGPVRVERLAPRGRELLGPVEAGELHLRPTAGGVDQLCVRGRPAEARPRAELYVAELEPGRRVLDEVVCTAGEARIDLAEQLV